MLTDSHSVSQSIAHCYVDRSGVNHLFMEGLTFLLLLLWSVELSCASCVPDTVVTRAQLSVTFDSCGQIEQSRMCRFRNCPRQIVMTSTYACCLQLGVHNSSIDVYFGNRYINSIVFVDSIVKPPNPVVEQFPATKSSRPKSTPKLGGYELVLIIALVTGLGGLGGNEAVLIIASVTIVMSGLIVVGWLISSMMCGSPTDGRAEGGGDCGNLCPCTS